MSPAKTKAARELSWLQRLDSRIAEAVAPAAADGNLTDEIAILRLQVLEILQEPDVATRAVALSRIITAIRQLVMTQRLIQGDAAEDVATSIANILTELGLAE